MDINHRIASIQLGSACALILLGGSPALAQIPAGFQQSLVSSGLDGPTAMEFAPDGRLFVCEKGGALRVAANGSLLQEPFLTVDAATESERGLLGIAFDPAFASNRYLYVYYTRAAEPIKNRISRFTASVANPNVAEPGSELVILDNIASDAGNHNGGAIHFGTDGKLYAGVGDGGASSSNSQSLSNLSGKLLRVDPGAYPNIVPPDNPFVGTSGARGEIWALGLRNPFTFAVQPGTGTIFINDVGSNAWEEVNRAAKGGNYGWPAVEGNADDPDFIDPVYSYPRGSSASIAGGAFYQATQFPGAYTGNYFFADYIQGFLRRLLPADYTQVREFAGGLDGVVDLKVGPDGQLYWLSINSGEVYKIGALPIRGDFNADRTSEILWRLPETGANLLWLMSGTTQTGVAYLPAVADPNWQIGGTGDFDGDGKTDILWRNSATGANTLWRMNGTVFAGSVSLPPMGDRNWSIVGSGDFSGDGKSDILWRNALSGANSVWTMNGTVYTGAVALPAVAGPDWQVVGTGHFDGGGKLDIVWRNRATGANTVWLMNGTTFAKSLSLPSVGDTRWEIGGVGDYNNDAAPDLVWRNIATGENAVWLMNGTVFLSRQSLPLVADARWQVRGPR
ncbi:PQQ-dependent sugar dehydrogenase [Gloeobacter violaceus]|uniref:Glr2261 protein n=1 Tax=Gloeobacter violaceus (strain ATCC 29082 / PCC 7421) TaxID=251221 RepID=Q7NIC2_GLOVI|nr:PQQ-dependent sugar dehydrogenase [Gloeobacter violaceus]BAC90202.1 glr2261 [Gloeobacter violaceus PCC 7421]